MDRTPYELDINKNVLTDIASATLERIEGVEIASSPLKMGEVLRAPSGRPRSLRAPRALKVSRDEAGVTIEVGLNVEYGKNLVALAQEVQRALCENVQLMTGLKVCAVNVTVQGLTLPRGA